jgi:hypothetical protein
MMHNKILVVGVYYRIIVKHVDILDPIVTK